MAEELKDSSGIAESQWDLGNFFSRRYLVDSAFYYYNKAYDTYSKIGNEYHAARMLLNLAIIKNNIKDFTGSEISTIKAINIFMPLGKHRQLYLSFNNLGIVYNELEEYDKALDYHRRALEYQELLQEKHTFRETSLNNIGVVFQNIKDFERAEKHFLQAIKNEDLFYSNTRLYAMILDNLAYARFSKKDTSGVRKLFQESLDIRDSIGHVSGVITSYVHLAEYNHSNQNFVRAKKLLQKAKVMAAKTNDHHDLLKISLLLSEIDPENKRSYLHDYIYLNDSLQKKERAIRNKFARIEFETDEFIAENQQLNEQRKWIIGGSGGILFLVLLFVTIWRQKSQNKKLQLEQDQQRANEEIYNLLLVQQNRLEEGRHQEKERISKELHDSILGKLFGTRLMLESLLEKSDRSSLDSKRRYLNDLRHIEEEVRGISHELHSDFLSQKQSFIDVLETFLADQEKIGKFEILFQNDEQIPWDKLNSEIKINLFRIIQEGFNNIHKHSDASFVSLVFEVKNDLIRVVISDNGKGFNIHDKRRGIGLNNIHSRAAKIGADLNISSNTRGTQMELNIPVNPIA